MVEIRTHRDGGRFETAASYARVKRVGPFVYVAGTTAVERTGRIHAPGNVEEQTRFVLARIAIVLEAVGASLADVVRTTAYLADLSQVEGYVRAHGEAFAGIEPVATAVGAELVSPGLVVEVEVDAIVAGALG